MKISGKTRKIFIILLTGILALSPFATAESMQSSNYRIDNDSINFGGTDESGSANYRISDTMGEVGTGEMSEKCSSLSFDGSSSYIDTGNGSVLSISNGISISAWIKPMATLPDEAVLVRKASNDCGNYNLQIKTHKLAFLSDNKCSWSYAGANSTITDGVWQFVAVVADGSNLYYYINGVKTDTVTGWTVGGVLSDALTIGGYSGAAFGDRYKGNIDDVRIYNRALSSTEVLDLYDGKHISGTGLVGYWNFNEESGYVANDMSGNGNNGVFYGSVLYSSNYPSQTCNVISAGYRGMNQTYISISSPADAVMSPAIGGVSGGTGDGSAVWNVKTDSPAGYQMSVRAGTSPALKSGSYSFADYTPSTTGVPDYEWSIGGSTSEFGYTVEGGDAIDKFLDNGSVCNAGSANASGKCWLNFSTSDQTIVSSASPNHPLGTDTTIRFRAQSGSSYLQPEGSYTATIIVTAVEL